MNFLHARKGLNLSHLKDSFLSDGRLGRGQMSEPAFMKNLEINKLLIIKQINKNQKKRSFIEKTHFYLYLGSSGWLYSSSVNNHLLLSFFSTSIIFFLNLRNIIYLLNPFKVNQKEKIEFSKFPFTNNPQNLFFFLNSFIIISILIKSYYGVHRSSF